MLSLFFVGLTWSCLVLAGVYSGANAIKIEEPLPYAHQEELVAGTWLACIAFAMALVRNRISLG